MDKNFTFHFTLPPSSAPLDTIDARIHATAKAIVQPNNVSPNPTVCPWLSIHLFHNGCRNICHTVTAKAVKRILIIDFSIFYSLKCLLKKNIAISSANAATREKVNGGSILPCSVYKRYITLGSGAKI
jgi:hypothetical protein